MNYLVAVLRDRLLAESVYSTLAQAGLPINQITILGQGYQNIDEYGLVDPFAQAGQRAKFMATWLVPFGFAAGCTFSLITKLDTFAWAGEWGNHLLGGVLGAIAGAMGSIFVGGDVSLIFNRAESLPYRDRLNAGKYLIVVKGSEALTYQATKLLRQFELENIHSYVSHLDK